MDFKGNLLNDVNLPNNFKILPFLNSDILDLERYILMSDNVNYYKHLLHIYENLYSLRLLPFEARVKPIKKLINYFKKYLSNEVDAGIKQVLDVQQMLFEAYSEAMHFESSYELLYSAFCKARDQLKYEPSSFIGFGDLLEQIPCKSSPETIIYLLSKDDVSIDHLVRLHLAEHNAILHPEVLHHISESFEKFTF